MYYKVLVGTAAGDCNKNGPLDLAPIPWPDQARFTLEIGVSQGYLPAVEHGEAEIDVEVLGGIAREFGMSIEWLQAGEG